MLGECFQAAPKIVVIQYNILIPKDAEVHNFAKEMGREKV